LFSSTGHSPGGDLHQTSATMLERISARFSRKHIKQTSAAPLRLPSANKSLEPHDRHVPPSWLSQRSGEVRCASSTELAQPRIEYFMVGYQALDPYGDAHILEARLSRSVSFDCFTRNVYIGMPGQAFHRAKRTFIPCHMSLPLAVCTE